MTLLQEMVDEQPETIVLSEAIEAALIKEGIISKAIGAAGSFFAKNPALTIAAGAMAVNAYGNYKKNKRNTLRLFAKDAYEKKMMTDISDMLTRSGKFKLKKMKYADGGKYWEFKRMGY